MLIFKFLKSERGSAPIVAAVLLFPLLICLIYSAAMYGQMADVSSVVEESARAGARYYAAHHGEKKAKDKAKEKAQEVVTGSVNVTPVKEIEKKKLTFDKKADIVIKKDGGYAFCEVTYHYPTPATGLLRLAGGDNLKKNLEVTGKAYFKAGEGD